MTSDNEDPRGSVFVGFLVGWCVIVLLAAGYVIVRSVW